MSARLDVDDQERDTRAATPGPVIADEETPRASLFALTQSASIRLH